MGKVVVQCDRCDARLAGDGLLGPTGVGCQGVQALLLVGGESGYRVCELV